MKKIVVRSVAAAGLCSAFVPAIAAPASASSEPVAKLSRLCTDKPERIPVMVKLIRPGQVFRVHPSAEEIVKRGESSTLLWTSPVWGAFAQQVCDKKNLKKSTSNQEFLPRIVVYSDTLPFSEAIVFEYPDAGENIHTVRMKLGGEIVMVERSAVRYLLDYSGPIEVSP